MISFTAALDAGADGIESDLHLTADKVLVLIHDNTLDRTTNCTGYIGNYTLAVSAAKRCRCRDFRRGEAAALTSHLPATPACWLSPCPPALLQQLASCNANYASVFGSKWGFQPIPTFEQAVALVASRGAAFVLDLKENALLGAYIRPVVDKYNVSSRVVMSCWTFDQVRHHLPATYHPPTRRWQQRGSSTKPALIPSHAMPCRAVHRCLCRSPTLSPT